MTAPQAFGKRRELFGSRNAIKITSCVRHLVPKFGDPPAHGPDTRIQSVYLAEGTSNGDPFGAVAVAPDNFDPRVDMYGRVSFEHHEKSSAGIKLMMTKRPSDEIVEHPEIANEEQAAALVTELRALGRNLYSGEKVLLDVPFQDKEAAKARGARWSSDDRKWFVMSGLVHLAQFAEWIPPDTAPAP